MWLRFFGVVMFLGCGLAALGGLVDMFQQDRAVRVYVEVPAKVLSSELHVQQSRRSTTYTPEITYSYRVDGTEYTSTQVSVWGVSFDYRSEADPFMDHYPADAHVKAWVDPADAKEAVLVKEYAAGPYWLALVGGYLALVGVMMTVGAARTGPSGMRAVPMGEGGWSLLLPKKNLQKRYRESVAWCVGTVLVVGAVAGHYVARAQTWGSGGVIMLVIAGLLLGWQLVRTVRHWNVRRAVSDARVMIHPAPLRREGPVAVRVEMDALRTVKVEGATVKVVCMEHYVEQRGSKRTTGHRAKGERTVEISAAKQVAAGEMVEGEGTVELDPSWPPTSRDQVHYPYYVWEVQVRVKLAGAADYAEDFVIEVG